MGSRAASAPKVAMLSNPIPESPWQRVNGSVAIPELLRSFKVDPGPLIKAAGLAPDVFDRPDNRYQFGAIGPFYQACVEATGCAHFGLAAGDQWTLDDLGPIATLMRCANTVGDALRLQYRYQYLYSQTLAPFLHRRDEVAELSIIILHPAMSGLDQVIDHIVATQCNILRGLIGPEFKPSVVLFAHAPPRHIAPLKRVIGCELQFDAPFSLVRIPSALLDQRLPGADPQRQRLIEQQLQQEDPDDFVVRVERTLAVQIRLGDFSAEGVAAGLGLHRRTLHRRLARHGTTFQALLDIVRLEVAQQLLGTTAVRLDTIASLLGYASVSPFLRAFTRWTGKTPGRWRAETRALREQHRRP